MKTRRLLPLLALPAALLAVYTTKEQGNKKTSTRPAATSEASEIKDISPLKDLAITPEVTKAIDEMIEFLNDYTGNKQFNRGTKKRLIEGLKVDYDGIKEAAKNKDPLSRKLANNYPNNKEFFNGLVRSAVEREANQEIDESLARYGVDPATVLTPDDAPITKHVTRAELHKFRDNRKVLEDWFMKSLPEGKVLIFRGGMNSEALQHIKAKKPGLPPGAILVDASFTDQYIDVYTAYDLKKAQEELTVKKEE